MMPLFALLLLAAPQIAERATAAPGGMPVVKLTATGVFTDGTTRVFGVTGDTGDGVPRPMTLAVTCTGGSVSSAMLADGGISAMDDWEAPVVRAMAGAGALPRDAASGLATGKRMHKPFVMRAELDRQALATTNWDLKSNTAPRSSGLGAGKVSLSDIHFMRVSLSNVSPTVCSLH